MNIRALLPLSHSDFLSGGDDKVIRLWRIRDISPTPIASVSYDSEIVELALIDKSSFLSGNKDFTITSWQIINERDIDTRIIPVDVYKGHTSHVNSILVFPETDIFLSASSDNSILKWKIGVTSYIGKYLAHKKAVNALAFLSPTEFISGGNDRVIFHWDIDNMTAPVEIFNDTLSGPLRTSLVSVLATLPDQSFVSGGFGAFQNNILRWKEGRLAYIDQYVGGIAEVTSLLALSDSVFVSGYSNGSIAVWMVNSSVPTLSLNLYTTPVTSLIFIPDYGLISASQDSPNIYRWKSPLCTSGGVHCLFDSSITLKCSGGYFCPPETTSVSNICPAGSYCPEGSAYPIPCGMYVYL
jgi:WD40 repeat protein